MSARQGTLVDAIRATASEGGQDFIFHLEDGQVRRTTADVLEEAERRATVLASRIEPGEPVGVLGPNAPDWVYWAVAAWMAGGVVAPVPYPLRLRDPETFAAQTSRMMEAIGCRVVASHPKFVPALPEGLALPWDAPRPAGPAPGAGDRTPDDVAVVQFTSGSTSSPKAAVLTHRAILAASTNLYRHQRLRPGTDGDRSVSWLPFFHDNGFFGHVVLPLTYRGESHVLPTERFAKNPAGWFRLASEVRAAITSGPSSAWSMALRAALRRPDGIDLSALRIGMMSAEAIDPDTVERLTEDGPAVGLKPNALAGAYGMAEATLGLTISAPWGGIEIDRVDLEALASDHRAVPAASGRTKRVASCGEPIPGVEVRIAGPEGVRDEREVGEIQVRAPSLMRGYVGPDAPDPFEDGWLHTGDLGYLAGGLLYVTGRIKEMIISYGRNYNPQDIEWAATRVPEVREGRVVAFAADGEAEGKLVVAFEPAREDGIDGVLLRIRQTVADVTGLTPRAVVALPKGAIQRTTSGKLRRTAMRDAWIRGDLGRIALAVEPAGGGRERP